MSDSAKTSAVRQETIQGALELARIFREKDIPLYLHSAPGIGKSDIMRQLATELKIGFIDIRVGTMLPEDLTGIPVPDLEKKVAIWLRANFWPNADTDGKEGIIAFDELADANRQLQSCIYRVILDRQIGEYKLPPGWWPMAAGNRREDRAAAQAISTALANRFAHVHVRPDEKAWLDWAAKHDISPMLMGFIKWRPALLHSMEGADLLAFPSPRSWAKASKVFDNRDPGLRFRLVAAIVGEGAALEVETFFKGLELPDFEDILKNPLHALIPEAPASRYALTSLLARKLDRENFPQVYKYIMREDFGADFCTVVVLEAAQRDVSLTDTKTFVQWAKNNKSLHI